MLYFTGGGIDYDSGPHNVTFPAGVTNVTFNVMINNDNILEENEIFTLSVTAVSLPSKVTNITSAQATVTIMDDDSKCFTIGINYFMNITTK